MFLDLDAKEPSSRAAKDGIGNVLLYGELVDFIQVMRSAVPPRGLVFCLCANDCESLAGYLGLYDAGCVPLLLDAAMDKALLDNLASVYEPEYLWCPVAADARAPLVSFKGYKLVRLSRSSPLMHEDLAILLTTSGSTGSPKLVRHKYGNLEWNAGAVAGVFRWTTEERGLCQLPMHYTMGLNVINSLLHAGATVLLSNHSLMSRDFWDFLKTEQATSFTGVPYSYEILQKMKLMKMDLPHLRTLASGGGKLPEELFRNLAEYAEATGRRFYSTFGATETSARLSFLPPHQAVHKVGSIGLPIPGGEMYLVDKDGCKFAPGVEAEGELVYRGPNVTAGYAQNQADLLLGDVFRGEYHTGDIARRDAEGYYYIVGRKSRFLKLFGHRVSLDVCEKLVADRFVGECVCMGTDKQMTVFVTDEAGADAGSFLAETTGLPRTVFRTCLIPEIPRFGNGKVNYRELDPGSA